MTQDIPIKCCKPAQVIRFLTFNVNGLRTLFHYQPFSSMNQSIENVFDYFDADIITFQELKVEKSTLTRWGKLDNFYSFISIPQTRRGYSGVGCWIRILPDDHPLHNSLKVLKAEEGITGRLSLKIGKNQTTYASDSNIGIGGYDSLPYDDEQEALKIDSEGRSVMVELASSTVVICVYCPANSTLSDEGELFRIKFLKVLFKRIRNLDAMGKKVVLLGDLNVCRDLIDHAESLEKASVPTTNSMGGLEIEEKFRTSCRNFIIDPDAPHRRLLNQMLSDSMFSEMASGGILVDTTRLKQSRKRLKMYTVWNTFKNSRPANYGSRIDFVLASTSMGAQVKSADILPQVMGSDHCPVYADIICNPSDVRKRDFNIKIPKFEARYKYDLMHGNILDMFGKAKNQPSFGRVAKNSALRSPRPVDRLSKKEIGNITMKKLNGGDKEKISQLKNCFGEPPSCKHGEKTILRTSKTLTNPGKRFWICKYPKGTSEDKSSSCDFFQWV
ncbi:class II abasic (AP) endonuclease [Zygosaccharomyces mellis]|uniref:DNA-(apurinic or apyrimidinic site) endonuclease 2 n=1 Tax=Zygosaccharomyces mellis TaxID=42258 RepID=A0A4C2EHB1_9SACH|nr:class II abasic (AP) endonuclease [Zygosaccharomyces mellis]